MSEIPPDDQPALVAYGDDEGVVLCDRRNPNAWIRTDTAIAVADVECDRFAPV